ncbi:unnamed protein product [Adineta steineri]|uniref:Uncharacterized protein n=1 Tax=Adineta steineri TaxID=433720 RepID=A0A814Q233_9BILA|nr:unnamed protein product [Adineta steineri]CAF1113614.1 unnamed protein product [Adineta steineri]
MLMLVVLISMMGMTDGQHNHHWPWGNCNCDTSSWYSGDHHCHCPTGTRWPGYEEKIWDNPNHQIFRIGGRSPPLEWYYDGKK